MRFEGKRWQGGFRSGLGGIDFPDVQKCALTVVPQVSVCSSFVC